MAGLAQVDLSFEGLAMTLTKGKKKEPKQILDGSIRGRARPGRLLAIMGPSGKEYCMQEIRCWIMNWKGILIFIHFSRFFFVVQEPER